MTNESNSRKNWALLVGINAYNSSPLNFCVNDMEAIENRLLQIGFSREKVLRLTWTGNEEIPPTRNTIQNAIRHVCKHAQHGDFISIFLSGHGCQFGDTPYYCALDVTLEIDWIYKQLRESKAQFKLIVVDACRNINHILPSHIEAITANQMRSHGTRSAALAADLVQLREPPPGVALLSSCADGEVSLEVGKLQHGVFTHFFLEGLTGKADADKDGVISFLELCSYVINKTRDFTENEPGISKIQTPYIKGDFTDFPFARVVASPSKVRATEVANPSGTNTRNISTPNPLNQMTNPWELSESEFAKRLGPDATSQPTFTIPQGTRVLMSENGIYLGEASIGTFTPQTFWEKLKGLFKSEQQKKQISVVLVRQEDVPLELNLPHLLTADDRCVDVAVSFVVQINDIASFVKNLFGSRRLLSSSDMEKTVGVIISQGLRETVKRLSSETLDSPETRDCLITGIKEAVNNSLLGRYGIDLADIHLVEIYNKEKESLRGIQRDERENDLAVLAAHVKLDRKEADIALDLRRNQLRKDIRKVTQSDQFDDIKSKEDFEAFLLQIDKQKLLRDDEKHELTTLFESKKHDREAARDFIARKLELDRTAELDRLQAELEHAQKAKTIQYEMELARLTDDESSRLWIQTLENEAKRMELAHQEAVKNRQRTWELNVKNMPYMRAEEWDELLHKQKIARQESEFKEEDAARKVRIARIEDEYAIEQKRREHGLGKEIAEDQYAMNKRVQDDQMSALERMQEMNRKRDEAEAELRLKTEAQRHQQKTEELKVRATMSTEALIATADKDNAAALANVEMSKHESQAQSKMREGAAQRERELQEKRLQDAQASNAATLAAIQNITGQAFGAMGQVAGRPVQAQDSANSVPVQNVQNAVRVCTHCRAENKDSSAKFCANCGKEL